MYSDALFRKVANSEINKYRLWIKYCKDFTEVFGINVELKIFGHPI